MNIHGWLVIDKPRGLTSVAAGAKIRRALNTKKIGHAGTLDPAAEGILPLALGEATKSVPLYVDCSKSYRFAVKWGESRDTGDDEGAVTFTGGRIPELSAVLAALPALTGNIEQVPPVYSAIKFAGRRACDLARAGTPPDMVPRQVRVDAFRHEGRLTPDTDLFSVDCGKGTYIRSLAVDLAAALNCAAYVTFLRRTRVGPFTEADAISPDAPGEILYQHLIGLTRLPEGIPALTLQADEAAQVRCGIGVQTVAATAPRVVAFCNGAAVALGSIEAAADGRHRFLPSRVFSPDAVKGPLNHVDYLRT